MQVEKKKLNAFDIYTLGVGGAIGSGIFVMMGSGIAYTGRSIVLAVSVGCLYMLLAYLFHPVMSSMFVVPGGDYDMKAMLLGPTMTGFSALTNVVGSLGMASYSISFASYFTSVFTGLADYQEWIALLIPLIFFAFSIRGPKALATLTSVITVILLVSIVVFIGVGVPQVQPGYWSNADGGFWVDGFSGFIGAIAMMSFACQGSTMGPVSVMPVTKNARRVIPLTILFITLTVGVVYGLMAYVAAGVLSLDQVAGQNLSVVASAIFNPALFAVFILGAACCAILSSFASGLTQIRYPLQSVANDGWLPSVFKKTTKNGYPYVVMGLYLIFAIVPIFTSLSVDTLISLTMIPMMIINTYMNISLIRLVKKYPAPWKNSVLHMPFPLFCCLCALGTLCALAVAYYLFIALDVTSMILCVVILAVLLILSRVQLMRGVVKKEDLLAKREEIAAAALAATAAEDN